MRCLADGLGRHVVSSRLTYSKRAINTVATSAMIEVLCHLMLKDEVVAAG